MEIIKVYTSLLVLEKQAIVFNMLNISILPIQTVTETNMLQEVDLQI